jgi:hypothetical protein
VPVGVKFSTADWRLPDQRRNVLRALRHRGTLREPIGPWATPPAAVQRHKIRWNVRLPVTNAIRRTTQSCGERDESCMLLARTVIEDSCLDSLMASEDASS